MTGPVDFGEARTLLGSIKAKITNAFTYDALERTFELAKERIDLLEAANEELRGKVDALKSELDSLADENQRLKASIARFETREPTDAMRYVLDRYAFYSQTHVSKKHLVKAARGFNAFQLEAALDECVDQGLVELDTDDANEHNLSYRLTSKGRGVLSR